MTTASEQRGLDKKVEAAADAKRRQRKDDLLRERDLALGEIGRELAQGKRLLEERAKRARTAVFSEFSGKIARLKP